MRLILILAAVGVAIYFMAQKAVDSFKMKDIEKHSDKILGVSMAQPVEGGSIASSIGNSLSPYKVDEVLQSYRFSERMPPDSLSLQNVQYHRDSDSRTILVKGEKEAVNSAIMALRDMDRSADSCEVRTWAVYVDRSLGNGYDLTAAIRAFTHGDIGMSVTPGVTTLTLSGPELAAALDVIADGNSVDVLQRPHLTLLHGQPAEVEASSEVPLPQVSTTGTGVSQSGVVYRKVGLRLLVEPYFLSRERVRLKVTQENGLIGATVNVADGLTAPIIETQRVSSSVEIAVGECVVLGGVSTERLSKTKGFLRNITEKQRGLLYVVLSTAPITQKAIPVRPPALSAPFEDVPYSDSMPDAAESLDGFGALLPPPDFDLNACPLPMPATKSDSGKGDDLPKKSPSPVRRGPRK